MGNLRIKGSCRFAFDGGGPAINIVPGSNSGLVASVAYVGVGLYTITFNEPLAPGDQCQYQLEAAGTLAAGGHVNSNRATTTTEAVATFSAAATAIAAERSFNLVVSSQLEG